MSTSAQQAGTMFSPELVTEMFNAVSGHSALAKLAPEVAIPFTGREEMVFTADGEAQLVAEGGAKAASDATVTPGVIRPVKVIYQKEYLTSFLRRQTLQGFRLSEHLVRALPERSHAVWISQLYTDSSRLQRQTPHLRRLTALTDS